MLSAGQINAISGVLKIAGVSASRVPIVRFGWGKGTVCTARYGLDVVTLVELLLTILVRL